MSSDGQFLAIAHESSPYLTLYSWNSANNRYEKTTQQDYSPTGNGFGLAVSSNGEFIAVGHYTSPYLTTYKRSLISTHTLKAYRAETDFSPLPIPADLLYIGVMTQGGNSDDVKAAKMIYWKSDPLETLDP